MHYIVLGMLADQCTSPAMGDSRAKLSSITQAIGSRIICSQSLYMSTFLASHQLDMELVGNRKLPHKWPQYLQHVGIQR